ncbi:MAG: hypothetical protein A2283_11340 [Lentisphaerae bacterium RIFOXYA12_FULL_48_11]|nr:MAG: hypothetical protein A2283_11340 [Lentisphaerae bacterium RIFOXYA12_FULL_48_11]
MINTLYSLDAFGTSLAFLLALLTGFVFGLVLKRGGFSSARRLANVFYFINKAVVKIMVSTLVIAMLVILYMAESGRIHLDQTFLMTTIYGAQIVGGLLFGIGFVMGAWRPGTVAANIFSGSIDASLFLLGTIGGSILFNEVFPVIYSLYTSGDQVAEMIHAVTGMSLTGFVLAFILVTVAVFWLSELAEKARTGRSLYIGPLFLKAYSLTLVTMAGGLFVMSFATTWVSAKSTGAATMMMDEQVLIERAEQELDYIKPEELADRLMASEPNLVAVDVRPADEFNLFHIRGALNVPLAQLAETLQLFKNKGLIVLYSNGTTDPSEARDSLRCQGFGNIYMLTGGLQGFWDHCLKSVSLRPEPLTIVDAARFKAWGTFFSMPVFSVKIGIDTEPVNVAIPRVAETVWLTARLGTPNFKVIDLRPQQEYNTAHIPGALSLNVEALSSNTEGLPSVLLPAPILAAKFSLLGLQPTDTVVLVSGDKLHDCTLAGMALERLGHMDYAIINGGYAKWEREGRPLTAVLTAVTKSKYPVKDGVDDFSVNFRTVVAHLAQPDTVIIDVRPEELYTGKKSDEACIGHIPGAINRVFTEDVVTTSDKEIYFRYTGFLATGYSQIIPSTNTEVIVYCRTGHQASQTFFVLKHLLGYQNVRCYDAGWTEWAARLDIPITNMDE